jgi:DNA-directed RNA polymerase subunit beta'
MSYRVKVFTSFKKHQRRCFLEGWASIKLHEPMVNPVMEDPARRILGLTEKQLHAVIAGRENLPGGGTRPQGIAQALKDINLPVAIGQARAEAARRRGAGRDDAIRRLHYLQDAQKMGLHPGDWVLNRMPVLPPAFRPVGELGDAKIPVVADPNLLYRDLIEANNNLKNMSGKVTDLGDERLAVYHTMKAVTGLGEPLSKELKDKRVKGLLGRLLGSSPKMGSMQRRLLSQTVDLVGRGVVAPNPDLDMDSIEVPEDHAWGVYKNFIARRLRRRGMPLTEALRNVEDRTPSAREELLNEMNERPVLMSRAPVLHRFGIMAFWPRLTKNNTIGVSPLVIKGFNAEHRWAVESNDTLY